MAVISMMEVHNVWCRVHLRWLLLKFLYIEAADRCVSVFSLFNLSTNCSF